MKEELIFLNKEESSRVGFLLSFSFLDRKQTKGIVHVNGALDNNNTINFENGINPLIEKNENLKTLVFDLYKLTYISSAGIGSFITILSKSQKKNIHIYLLKLNKKLKSVFDLLGFSRYFDFIYDLTKIADFRGEKSFIFKCPKCEKMLKTSKSGKYRCPGCSKMLTLSDNGIVELL